MLEHQQVLTPLEKKLTAVVQTFAEPLAKKGFLINSIKDWRIHHDGEFEINFKADDGTKVSIKKAHNDPEGTVRFYLNNRKINDLTEVPLSGEEKIICANKIDIRKSIQTRQENGNELGEERQSFATFGIRRGRCFNEAGWHPVEQNAPVKMRSNTGPIVGQS